MQPIIQVTKNAKEHLKEVLATRAKKPNQCLRLVAGPAGVGIFLDTPKNEDEVIEAGGTPVLLVHPLLSPALEGTTLDYRDYPEGSCLTLTK